MKRGIQFTALLFGVAVVLQLVNCKKAPDSTSLILDYYSEIPEYSLSKAEEDLNRLRVAKYNGKRISIEDQYLLERLTGYFYENDPIWRLRQELSALISSTEDRSKGEGLTDEERKSLMTFKVAMVSLSRLEDLPDSELIEQLCKEIRLCIVFQQAERLEQFVDEEELTTWLRNG